MISQLEKLIDTPRDGALLRYSLGLEHAKEGNHARAIEYLRDAVARDPLYSAA
jgi:Flp pilus assembly protein TadD